MIAHIKSSCQAAGRFIGLRSQFFAGGEKENLRARFFAVAFKGQRNQAVEQLGIGRPLASQSFGYMLMEVKPGMVLISFR